MQFIESGARVAYIAGPVSGHDDLNRPAFHAAARHLRDKGWKTLVPLDYANTPLAQAEAEEHGKGAVGMKGWQEAMRRSICLLLAAERVYVLPGWKESRGASTEVMIAMAVGIPVYDVMSDEPLTGVKLDVYSL